MAPRPNLPQFLGAYPLLSIDPIVSNHRVDMMTSVDVALRFGPAEGASLIARKLFATRVPACAAAAYLVSRGAPATPHDLLHRERSCFAIP
jgi:DNA-binding transcriptional LysR family regulator